MAFCPNCGSQNNDGAQFCTNCGTKLETVQDPLLQNNAQQPQYQPQPQYNPPVYTPKPKVPGRGFGITSMVLGIIAAVYAYALLNDDIDYFQMIRDYGMDSDMISDMVLIAILAALALVFALCAFGRKFTRGQAVSGLVLSGASMLVCLLSVIIVIV